MGFPLTGRSSPCLRNLCGQRNRAEFLRTGRSVRRELRPGSRVDDLASAIVCLRSIPKTPAIIDVGDRVLAEEARDSGDSTPAIRKTRSQQRVAGAGRPRRRRRPPAARWIPRFSLPFWRRDAPVSGRMAPISPADGASSTFRGR
jgi:hypothetical protein